MARVLVVGAGALGGLIGALLREARHDVLLLGRGEQVRATTLEGLRVTGGAYGPARSIPVIAMTKAPAGFAPDLVLLAVKTQDVDGALREHGAAFGGAPVAAIQNGLAQDELVAQAVGRDRAVSCVASLDASFVRAGVVECARRGTLTIGARWKEGEPAADRARSILGDAVRAQATANALGARWTKLLVNLSNAVPAITGLSYQDAARHPLLSRANVRMIREGVAVSQAEGVALEPLPWTSPALLRMTSRAPEAIARRVYALRVRAVLGRKPAFGSTWQSVERGRSVETAWLNGEVARRGAARGVPTPTNAMALALVEKGERLTPDEAGRWLLGSRP